MNEPAIVAEGLVKHFGTVKALDGVDLEVHEGMVLGVLGPNGAGKTTAIRILATLLEPEAGTARVGGYDVMRQPGEVRGRENLVLVARLRHLQQAGQLADDLLARFQLTDAATRRVATYSGGMRRRLDLGARSSSTTAGSSRPARRTS